MEENRLGMNIKTRPLVGAKDTGREMYKMVDNFYTDMAPWATLSLLDIFRTVADIPFNFDPDGEELLKRPFYTMHRIGPGGDCDDKAICIAAWAKLNSYPYRFIATGRRKPGQGIFSKILLSHVLPQVYIYTTWLTVDATYSFNVLGLDLSFKEYDRIVVLEP